MFDRLFLANYDYITVSARLDEAENRVTGIRSRSAGDRSCI